MGTVDFNEVLEEISEIISKYGPTKSILTEPILHLLEVSS